MRNFKNYLRRKGYRENSVRGYSNTLQRFFDWCEESGIKPSAANLNELYEYIDFNRNNGNKTNTLRDTRKVITIYYQQIGRKTNPALILKIERPEKRLPKNLLDSDTLLELYLGYIPKNITQRRNKCILGLMVFQGLTNVSVEALELEHVNLEAKSIYIPSTPRTNNRTIKLRESQRIEFESYLYEVRPLLLKETKRETSKLFFSYGEGATLHSVLQRLKKEVRTTAPYVLSFGQLRESRMKIWIKEHGLREAQYLSGIRFVTSLLRYDSGDNDKLRDKLNVIHPLEGMGF